MNNSPEFRRQCEARYVAKMSKDQREEFYKGVLKERGREAANLLIADVNKMRKERKSKTEEMEL